MKEFLISLSTVLSSVVPPSEVSTMNVESYINSPIVGLWELTLDKKAGDCKEVYNFQADNKLNVISGAEWTSGSYRIIDKAEFDLPIFFLKTQYDDNNVDCSGNQEDQSGDSFIAYFKQTSPTSFELCAKKDGSNCFMDFNKVLP